MSKFYAAQFALFISYQLCFCCHTWEFTAKNNVLQCESHAISISQLKGNVIFKMSGLGYSKNVMRAGYVLVRFRIPFFLRANLEGSVLLVLAHTDRHSEDTDVSHYVGRHDLRSVPGQLTLQKQPEQWQYFFSFNPLLKLYPPGKHSADESAGVMANDNDKEDC